MSSMNKLLVELPTPYPTGRSEKQPLVGFCQNPACIGIEDATRGRYEFEVKNMPVVCPKCGANKSPYVGLLTLIHLIVPDPKGPIEGVGGTRQKLSCDSKRAYLATITNNEAATGDPLAANCPDCLKNAVTEGRIKPVHGYMLVAGDRDASFKS